MLISFQDSNGGGKMETALIQLTQEQIQKLGELQTQIEIMNSHVENIDIMFQNFFALTMAVLVFVALLSFFWNTCGLKYA